jgi:hypothetical protein
VDLAILQELKHVLQPTQEEVGLAEFPGLAVGKQTVLAEDFKGL